MTDGPYKLPAGWRWARVAEVCTAAERRDPSQNPGASFVYVDIAAIDNLAGEIISPRELKGVDAPSRARKVIRAGDVLFATTRPYLKNIALVPPQLDDQICSTGFCVIRVDSELADLKYVFFVCRSDCIVNQLNEKNMRGASYPAVTDNDVYSAIIPLPPLADQHRIVVKIEALIERVQEARHLQEGSRKETEALFYASLEEVLTSVYAKSPQIRPLGDFATAFNGRASGSGESKVRVFKTKHVYPFDLKQTHPSYMKSDQVVKCPPDRFLRSGDVLVCNIARGTLGRVCHVDSAEDSWTVDTQIMILRTDSRCSGKWLFYYLYSHPGQMEILAREKGIAFADKRGQTPLYPRDMLTIPVPLPSIDDQRRIVAYLDSVQAQAAALKRAQEDTDAELRRLEQAILDRAFRGEL